MYVMVNDHKVLQNNTSFSNVFLLPVPSHKNVSQINQTDAKIRKNLRTLYDLFSFIFKGRFVHITLVYLSNCIGLSWSLTSMVTAFFRVTSMPFPVTQFRTHKSLETSFVYLVVYWLQTLFCRYIYYFKDRLLFVDFAYRRWVGKWVESFVQCCGGDW